MTHQRNETPEPLAGTAVESCISALVSALQRDKGWLHDYADSVARDAIDRKDLDKATIQDSPKVAEPLNVVAYLVTNLSSGEPSICFEDERGDYGDEDHTPVFEALVRLSDILAALQAKDAEIARLKADAGRLAALESVAVENQWIVAKNSDSFTASLGRPRHATRRTLREAIDAAMKGEAA